MKLRLQTPTKTYDRSAFLLMNENIAGECTIIFDDFTEQKNKNKGTLVHELERLIVTSLWFEYQPSIMFEMNITLN